MLNFVRENYFTFVSDFSENLNFRYKFWKQKFFKFHEQRSSWGQVVPRERTNVKKLIVVFRSFHNAFKCNSLCKNMIYRVGFTLSQATKALRESEVIALLYFRPQH